MQEKLFIADKIKVGFNTRKDTYTGKLGYVIGHDGKKWRKEPSWESWREKVVSKEEFETAKLKSFNDSVLYRTNFYNDGIKTPKKTGSYDSYSAMRDKTLEEFLKYCGLSSLEKYDFQIYNTSSDESINPVEFDNVPTEGFVLNKKAGGYSSGWNHRATYCRVYDPRGFEFEISVPNLLFILQECNAYKGKGLEGSFVYAWDGKDLVLLPTSCEEFTQSTIFTKLQSGKVSTKDLVEGCSYKHKNMDEYIYLGKFAWQNDFSYAKNIDKTYVLYKLPKDNYDGVFESFSNLSSFVKKTNDVPVSNYVDLLDKFNKSKNSFKLGKITLDAYSPQTTISNYGNTCVIDKCVVLPIGDSKYEIYEVSYNKYKQNYVRYSYEYKIKTYDLKTNKILVLGSDDFQIKSIKPKLLEDLTFNEVEKMGLMTMKNNNKKLIF